MTKALEEVFAAAATLPDDEQDELAAVLMEELRDERAWRVKFQRSPEGRWADSPQRRGGSTARA